MSILDKLKKSSTIKHTSSLETSTFLDIPYEISTIVVAINIALGGAIDTGLHPGLLQIAGPSKHFKTNLALILASAFLKKFKDGIILFYDSEFGASKKYFKSAGIDPERVLHTPIKNVEELKFDLIKQLEEISPKDNVFILVDSIGNLASKKEVEDAKDGKSVADMSRAKSIKSLWRIVTPYLTLNSIPLVAINHTYNCGTENMLVQTEFGDVSLKDIKVGDAVLTTNGFEPVEYVVEHERALITEIELENGEVLEFTDQHRFLVNGKWKYVHELSVDDDIMQISEVDFLVEA